MRNRQNYIGTWHLYARFLLPAAVMLCIIAIFHYTDIFVVKFYPVAANLTVFLVFFISCFRKETVIQKFAKTIEGELDDFTKNYTEKLAYWWAGFTFLNFLISLATVFMPEKYWALYNGFISYALIGTFFAVEYIIRTVLRKKHQK